MKQRFWNDLKSQLCALQDWQKDQNIKNCQCCTKQFIKIIRRKHHCRLCGKIFCSNCSDFYINGKYLGLSEKYVRHCQFCRQKIQKIKKDCNKLLYLYDDQEVKSQSSEDEGHSSDEESEYLFNIRNIFGEKSVLCQLGQNLDQQIRDKSMLILKNLQQKFQLNEIQSQKLAQICLKAITESKMQLLPQNSQNQNKNYMDILKYIKVKVIKNDSNEPSRIVKGIILSKLSFSKKLLGNISKARILIIQNSIDIDSLANNMKFEDLIANEKTMLKRVLDKIIKLNVDLIFVQKSVSFAAFEYLQNNHIAVCSRVKLKDIEQIMRLTGIKKAVKNIWIIEKYKPQNIIGVCQTVYFEEYSDNKMLLFLENDVGIRSILLFNKNENALIPLKKIVQIYLKCLKQMQLEKYLFLIDIEIRDDYNQKNLPILTTFNREIYDNADFYLENQEIGFNLLTLQVLTESAVKDDWREYGNKRNKYEFFQICGKITENKVKIYLSGDITIGAHIFMDAQKYLKLCQKCKMKHIEYMYFDKNVIKVWYEQNLQKSVMEIIKEEEDLTLQKLKNYMRKHKQNFSIFTYFQCSDCNKMFGNKIKVGKNYLKNSLYHFLSLISKLNPQKSIKKSNWTNQNEKCTHSRIIRILQSSDIRMKIVVFPLQIYQIYPVEFKSQKSQLIRIANSQKFMRETIFEQIKNKKQIIQSLMGILNRRNVGPTSPTLKSNKQDYLDYYNKITNLIQIVHQQLEEIQNQQKNVKQFDDKYDWTIFTRKIYKIQNVLRSIIDILIHLEQQIFGAKKDQPIQIVIQEEKQVNSKENDIRLEDLVKEIRSISKQKSKDRESNRFRQTFTIKKQAFLSQQSQGHLKMLSKKVSKQRFPIKQGTSYLFYNIAYSSDPVSVLACCLNSAQFIKFHASQDNIEEHRIRQKFYRRIKSEWSAKTEADRLYHQIFSQDDEKSQIYEIVTYYHKQFEQLRVMEGVTFDKYVKSLCGCRSWDSTGGKSNSKFAKSHDQTLVVKIIKEKEFVQFHKFAKQYLKFIKNAKAKDMDSLLAKIFGIYEVTIGGKEYKCIVMQNIFFGISKPLSVYDLKGSQVNRCAPLQKQQKQFTGLDTNFKIDKGCMPYVLNQNEYDKIMQILENDANFLKEQQVIDYSLLVVQDHDNMLRMGIIDFMRPYYLMQKLENLVKQIQNKHKPTVIPPSEYSQRFITSMKRYFIKMIT